MKLATKTKDAEPVTQVVKIPCGNTYLFGELNVPLGAQGIVLFAHENELHFSK